MSIYSFTHDAFARVVWLIHMCDVTYSYVWHDTFIRVTWHIHMCDMTHSHVWHDSFTCVTWHHACNTYVLMRAMTHTYALQCVAVCSHSFMCVTHMHVSCHTHNRVESHKLTQNSAHTKNAGKLTLHLFPAFLGFVFLCFGVFLLTIFVFFYCIFVPKNSNKNTGKRTLYDRGWRLGRPWRWWHVAT